MTPKKFGEHLAKFRFTGLRDAGGPDSPFVVYALQTPDGFPRVQARSCNQDDNILNEEVENLGIAGDVVKVADGYARNYLLPRGLAVMATERSVRHLEHQKKVVADRQAKVVSGLSKEKQAIEALTLTVSAQAGEEGKLFGSVTTSDLASALLKEGVTVDRKRILLAEPIRQVGEHEVEVKLHTEVIAKFKVNVVAAESGSD